jgi:hypothetical protein
MEIEDEEALVAFAVIAVALVAAGGQRARASGGEFTAIVYPSGATMAGAYVSGKCVASVDVGSESVTVGRAA